MGHVVRDGLRATDNYESDDPHVLTDVALATDGVIALIQEYCDRRLSAIEPLLNPKEIEKDRRQGVSKNLEEAEG
jgi:hypothetical protein